jgi:hypothetical protein
VIRFTLLAIIAFALGFLVPLGLWAIIPAHAATITEIAGFDPSLRPVPLRASDFTRVGACGGGASVTGDGCGVTTLDANTRWGRYAGEIDSQDANQLWSLSFAQPRDRLQFSVSDMMDMPWSQSFSITSTADAVWTESQRQPSGTIRYFELALDKATTAVSILFQHAGLEPGKAFSGDGFGVGACRPKAR